MNKPKRDTVRRSVALPKSLVDEAQRTAPSELRDNFNRLVTVSLSAWIEARKRKAFEEEMAEMSRDPEIQKLNAKIEEDFKNTLLDGL